MLLTSDEVAGHLRIGTMLSIVRHRWTLSTRYRTVERAFDPPVLGLALTKIRRT
jgi:hypothetical protein